MTRYQKGRVTGILTHGTTLIYILILPYKPEFDKKYIYILIGVWALNSTTWKKGNKEAPYCKQTTPEQQYIGIIYLASR